MPCVRGRVWWPVSLLAQLLWHMLRLYKKDHAGADLQLCCLIRPLPTLMYTMEGTLPGIGAVKLQHVFSCTSSTCMAEALPAHWRWLLVGLWILVFPCFEVGCSGTDTTVPRLSSFLSMRCYLKTEMILASSQVWYKERWYSWGIDAQRTSFQS